MYLRQLRLTRPHKQDLGAIRKEALAFRDPPSYVIFGTGNQTHILAIAKYSLISMSH